MSLHWRQIGLQEHNNYLCKRHISISDLPQSIAIYKHKIENEQFPWTNWIIIAETCNYWYKTKKDRLLLLLTYLISVLYWKNRNQNKCLCTWTFYTSAMRFLIFYKKKLMQMVVISLSAYAFNSTLPLMRLLLNNGLFFSSPWKCVFLTESITFIICIQCHMACHALTHFIWTM